MKLRIPCAIALSCWCLAGRVDAQEIEEASEEASEEVCMDAEVNLDSDGDGITDLVELETGTEPLDLDTDSDDVDDGDEDLNRDGVLDPGERDPRVAGLHHTAARLPEPLNFDLVRGLGARAGEVEVNTLVVVTHAGDHLTVDWAPEVEWAIADNFAVEFELPMHNAELHALKAAAQWTAPSPEALFAHGVQLIAEASVHTWEPEFSLLYLAGGRIGPATLFGMVGARAHALHQADGAWSVLANPSITLDLHEAVTVGIESNIRACSEGPLSVALIPQVHWQVSSRVRVQLGIGAEYVSHPNAAWFPTVAARLILE